MQSLLERRRVAARAGEPDVYERRRPDGGVLEIATNPMPDGGFVATFTDVTERHNAATALREANESLERRVAERTTALSAAKAEAEQANLSKTRFLASASHDLLQPLHAARLFTSALSDRRQDTLVAKVDASLRSVETLLGALLDVSKLDGGAVRPDTSAFPIDTILTALDEEFTAIARERGIGFRMVTSRLAVRSDPPCCAASCRISSPTRCAIRRTDVFSSAAAGTARRCASMSGIPAPAFPRRVSPTSSRSFTASSRSPLPARAWTRPCDRRPHRADARPSSRGTLPARTRQLLLVTVPIAQATPAAAPTVIKRRRRGFGGALVTCIDNDTTILEGMEALLGGWQCEVIGAANVAETLTRLGERVPDAVIVDYRLDEG